jgi:hypothetical protein
MLIEFRAENHRSLRDDQGLTFEAGTVDGDETRIRALGDLRLLPVAGIYGANASGKSNVLAALHFMREAVSQSYRLWTPDGGVPRDPFAWGEPRHAPSIYQATLLLDGVKHEYGFVVDDERVVEEWLHAWPNARKQTWFERDGGDFKFGEHLKGENRATAALTRSNSLFLSVAAQNNHAQLETIFRWFRNISAEGVREDHTRQLVEGPAQWLTFSQRFPEDDRDERLALFKEMLRAADVGIVDFRVTSDDGGPPVRGRRKRTQLLHKSSSADAWLPLEEESGGTQRLFRVGPLVINAIATGGVLLVDELDGALHPLLATEIIRAFHDPKKNKKNAQLIFTTHDTNLIGTLIGEPPLRRDQVWLTEKDDEGATRLFPLTDFKPRKSENLERGYLQGRYGAVPVLGELTAAEK